jgi:glycosyltransferase involved in cell wall biosynthesis
MSKKNVNFVLYINYNRLFLHYINPKNRIPEAEYPKGDLSKSLVLKKRLTNRKPLFSIIVPVYQEEKIIESHLKLFTDELREKFNFELIVSDGGSTDDTVKIAGQYADTVVIHQNPERQTISEGRNRGADCSTGDILVFLNVDSIPADLDSFINIIVEFSGKTDKYANCGALATNVNGFPDEVILKDKIFYFIYNNYVHFLNIIGFGMGRGECQVVRRDIFEKVQGYNDSIVAGEDFDLFLRISKISKVIFERKMLVYESPRRFRKYGYLKTIFFWFLNSLSVWWFGKSVSKEWEAVR